MSFVVAIRIQLEGDAEVHVAAVAIDGMIETQRVSSGSSYVAFIVPTADSNIAVEEIRRGHLPDDLLLVQPRGVCIRV